MDLKREEVNENLDNEYEGGKRGPKKAVLAAGVGILAAALLIGGFSMLKGCGGKKAEEASDSASMQSVFAEFLEDNKNGGFEGLEKLSDTDRDRIIAVSIDALERMIGDGKGTYNKQELVAELEKVINELGFGLPAETVHELAEKFVELYSQAFYEVYKDSELTNLTVKQMGDTITSEMRENLTSIADYLTQLDTEIVNNQSTLEKVIESNSDLGEKLEQNTAEMQEIREQVAGELTKISNSYSSLYNKFAGFEKQLGTFMETYVTNAQGVNTGIVAIQQNINETKERITATEKAITNALAAMESNNADRQESIDEQFRGVMESASETRALIRETEKSIQTAISGMSDEMKENHEEMVDMLTEMEAGLQKTMDEDMAEIEKSFSDLDASINSNMNARADEIKAQLGSTLEEIKTEFFGVNDRLEASEKQFSEFLGTYEKDAERIDSKLDSIQNGITETKAQLAATEQNITDTLAEMESNHNLRQDELNAKLAEVSSSIEDTKDQLADVETAIQGTLASMDSDMKENHKELVAALQELDNGIRNVLEEDMSIITQNFQTMQADMESEFAALNENLDVSVAGLKSQMDGIHSQITVTQEEIKNILKAMDEKSDMQCDEIMDAIDKAVSRIQADVNAAYNNLQALIRILDADMTEQHRDTLDALEGMEDSMAESMNDNLNQITNSFSSLDATLKQYFKEMQESQNATQGALDSVLGELGDNLKENQQIIRDELAAHDAANKAGQEEIRNAIKSHNADTLAGQDSLRASISGHDASVQEALQAIRTSVEEKFNSVFTSVSDGKKKLASALLTKGVSIDSDATFEEIKEAILNISQTIEVGGMPGTVEYDYHYHVDGSGNRTGNTEHLDSQGGCFSVAVYHTHGDACYNWSHEHNEHCKSHPVWVDWVEEPYWGAIYDCGDQPANVRGSLKCTLPESSDTPIYFEKGCGLSDGQIVAAHIVYEGAANTMSLRRVIEPEEGEIRAVGVINEPEYPVPIETGEAAENETETEEAESSFADETVTEGSESDVGTEESESQEEESLTESTEISEETETEGSETEASETGASETEVSATEMSETEISETQVSETVKTEVSEPEAAEPDETNSTVEDNSTESVVQVETASENLSE